ncbi:AAA family ATPase [Arthrobacter bambusae]|uniref:AAA family ATPase n=1 Tax=Arthrobacter bambusae TaxID=1338426 RepID=UPI00277E87C0|nr:ATP-binding protein [Arthrobacter bambusae]MDQ0031805.1 DNA polymerase III delta prime subunit [Arthrobacter bambusae]MDQ0099917.1 DNA polymerase III delta prime subunit [Arthrobacter bambusae]
MDEKLGNFIEDFATLTRLAQSGLDHADDGEQLLQALTGHLGVPAYELSVVAEEIPPHRLVDVDIIMEGLAGQDPDYRLVGIAGGDQRHHMSFSDMLQHSRTYPRFPLGRPDYTNLATGPEQQRQAVSLGLWLFTYGGSPVAVLQREARIERHRPTASLEVLATHPAVASGLLAEVRRDMEHRSVFKGQIIALTVNDYAPGISGVTFVRRPQLASSDVVLPEGLLDKVEGHSLGIARQADILAAHGQHLKRGLLLYGPPGTGKTHTVRYLLSQSEGTTAVLLSGGSLARVAEAAKIARALAPSIVVLEDCDLIAEDRSFGHGPKPLLFEVLDAMDGLDNDADVAFVLTTNRVDLLERALAQRPGRVDLAVEIPLPSRHERLGLLSLYSGGLPFSPAAIDAAAARTAGTTASFAKELIRRSVVAAALAGETPGDSHLGEAVDQLMADGEALTRSLLGSNGHQPVAQE